MATIASLQDMMGSASESLSSMVSGSQNFGNFPGPGLYRIVSYQHPDLALNSWGGSDNPEDVKLYPKSDDHPNSTFEFALANSNGEFVIINSKNGLFLTGNPNSGALRSDRGTPEDPKCRWTLEYRLSQGQYHTFFINCVDKSCGQMNIAGGGGDTGTAILSWPMENGENTLFYLDSKN